MNAYCLCFSSLLALLLPETGAWAAPEILWDWPAIVTTESARVHSEPNLDARAVAKLKVGTKLRVRWIDSEWLEIVEGAFPDRFMHKQVVSVLVRDPTYQASPEADSLRLKVRVTGSDVNLRKEDAAGKREIVTRLKKDTPPLEVRRKDGNWAMIITPSEWAGNLISTQYLELVDAPVTTPVK